MGKKKAKSGAARVKPAEQTSSGGALMGLRSGMRSLAGTNSRKKEPASTLDKIFDILFYVALLAFVVWFLYKKISL